MYVGRKDRNKSGVSKLFFRVKLSLIFTLAGMGDADYFGKKVHL